MNSLAPTTLTDTKILAATRGLILEGRSLCALA